MTISEDAHIISNAVMFFVVVPAIICVWSMIVLALPNGCFTTAEVELAMSMYMIIYGGIALSVLISAVGAFIDGGIAE